MYLLNNSHRFAPRLGRVALFHSQPAPAAITEASKDINYAVLPKKVSQYFYVELELYILSEHMSIIGD